MLFTLEITFTSLICVETFITVPSIQAIAPESPSASTSIVSAPSGISSSVKYIAVVSSGISELNVSPLFKTNVASLAYKSIFFETPIFIVPSLDIGTLVVHDLSVYQHTFIPFGILYCPSRTCPAEVYTIEFSVVPSVNVNPFP